MTMHALKEKTAAGFWIYLMSDCVLFGGLFAVYAVVQNATFGGPAVADFAQLPFVFAQTMLLLFSSVAIGIAGLAARDHQKTLALGALMVTLVLGVAFLCLEIQEFMHLLAEGWGPERSAALSAFFALVGTHGLHIFFGSLWMVLVLLHIAARGTAASESKLHLLVLFWHFLDIIWIFIFTFVYLFGLLAL